jgi:hypothetical protein
MEDAVTDKESRQLVQAIFEKGLASGRASLNEAQRLVFDLHDLDITTGMENLIGWYESPDGVNANRAVEQLRHVGDTQSAELLAEANSLFPGGLVPATQEEVWEATGDMDDETVVRICAIGYELVRIGGRISMHLYPYVAAHEAEMREGIDVSKIEWPGVPESPK